MAYTQPIAGLAWYDIADRNDPALDELAQRFSLHPLQIEDCRHVPQRAKYEQHDGYLFCVLKKLQDKKEVTFDDFDVFMGRDFMITVHGGPCDLLQQVKRRAEEAHKQHPEADEKRLDRVLYFILDEMVDEYLPEIDQLDDLGSEIEDQVLECPEPQILRQIFELKRSLVRFRRVSNGMREVVNALLRRDEGLIAEDLMPYFRDVYDHLVRTTDLIESLRDILTGSLDIYLSAVANRTNEVMKVLTVYGTVALPFVIITGFFGMNVKLPWMESPHGVWYVSGLMAISTLVVLAYFRRKHWW